MTFRIFAAASLLLAACSSATPAAGVSSAPAAAVADQTKPPAVQTQPNTNANAAVMADFNARIKTYVDLRDKAEKGLPPLTETKEAAKIKAAQDALAAAIRVQRAGAKRGDIFAPDIQRLFLLFLRPPMKGPDGKETNEVIEHDNPGKLALTINGKYPDEAPLSTVPPNVLASLPQLPETLGVEYRFVDKHLILRDSKANVIIDFIANVIR
jgi:hypothetical protein